MTSHSTRWPWLVRLRRFTSMPTSKMVSSILLVKILQYHRRCMPCNMPLIDWERSRRRFGWLMWDRYKNSQRPSTPRPVSTTGSPDSYRSTGRAKCTPWSTRPRRSWKWTAIACTISTGKYPGKTRTRCTWWTSGRTNWSRFRSGWSKRTRAKLTGCSISFSLRSFAQTR